MWSRIGGDYTFGANGSPTPPVDHTDLTNLTVNGVTIGDVRLQQLSTEEHVALLGSFGLDSGTAQSAKPRFANTGWDLGGKTGTADVAGAPRPDAWFAGLMYGPDRRARYSVVVYLRRGAPMADLLCSGHAACPGCGRTTSTVFQELAQTIQNDLRRNMPLWRGKYPGVEELKVAVMGCIVNGPGESKHAHIGIPLPGTGEDPKAPVFVDGERAETLRGEGIVPRFLEILDGYVAGINAYIADTLTAVGAQDVMTVTKNSETAAASADPPPSPPPNGHRPRGARCVR